MKHVYLPRDLFQTQCEGWNPFDIFNTKEVRLGTITANSPIYVRRELLYEIGVFPFITSVSGNFQCIQDENGVVRLGISDGLLPLAEVPDLEREFFKNVVDSIDTIVPDRSGFIKLRDTLIIIEQFRMNEPVLNGTESFISVSREKLGSKITDRFSKEIFKILGEYI